MSESDSPSGILLIDKPKDWTSHDVVNKVRRILNTRKVGHAGTLDPMATGLLIILVGKATKLSDQLLSQHKGYQATVYFGQQTDTGDADGQVINTVDASHLAQTAIEAILPTFVGQQQQMVPAYSAVKVDGQKLYNLARSGQTLIDRPVKDIEIYKLTLDQFNPDSSDNQPQATISIECSKGTYIRVLAEDIAIKLGTVGHLTALRRLSSGNFSLSQAVELDELINSPQPKKYLLPLEQVTNH